MHVLLVMQKYNFVFYLKMDNVGIDELLEKNNNPTLSSFEKQNKRAQNARSILNQGQNPENIKSTEKVRNSHSI